MIGLLLNDQVASALVARHQWQTISIQAHWRLIQGALAGCTLRVGRRILVDISTRGATCVTHLWSLYQEALVDYTLREVATHRSLPCLPPPRTPPSPRRRGPLATSSVRRRRFRARPLRHHPGSRDSGTTLQHPNPIKPLATGPPPRYRTGLGPPAYNHHTSPATSGTPAWGRTMAKQPTPPSCKEDTLWNPGFVIFAQRGWATVNDCVLVLCYGNAVNVLKMQ